MPRKRRFEVFRSFADCNPAQSQRLVLKIAETKEELEACFAVLHDAYVDSGLPLNTWCDMTVQLGKSDISHFRALALRENNNGFLGYYGFRLGETDTIWEKFVSALYGSTTYSEFDSATRFLE